MRNILLNWSFEDGDFCYIWSSPCASYNNLVRKLLRRVLKCL